MPILGVAFVSLKNSLIDIFGILSITFIKNPVVPSPTPMVLISGLSMIKYSCEGCLTDKTSADNQPVIPPPTITNFIY